MTPKQNNPKKSVILAPSRVISGAGRLEGEEEIEIAAQISLPTEGGWGWVVVFAAFTIVFILDGIVYTFGSMLHNVSEDFKLSDSVIPLANSIAVAVYLFAGPLDSALINRFGFRTCVMMGSIICSFSLLISYFMTNFASFCVFYGFTAGLGYSLINMSSALVVGFYFEKLRPVAMSITACGSSLGVMCFFPMNTFLLNYSDWRTVTLLHSGLCGLIFFLGMTFRPLMSLTVVNTTDDPCRTVTYLPNVSAALIRANSGVKAEGIQSTKTERLFSAVSNYNFPTAANVLDAETNLVHVSATQAGTSSAKKSRLTLSTSTPQGGVSRRQLKQVQSMVSKGNLQYNEKQDNEIILNVPETPKKRNLFQWESHVPESRPLYRDDAFYDGRIDQLPVYQKSMMNTSPETKTGLEYQLAVSRAAAVDDLKEHRGVFTTAARRVLATMMDPKLLKKRSFIFFCSSGFSAYLGFLVPYVYLPDRNVAAGIDPKHSSTFIMVIGFSNAIGRLILGALACKVNPVYLYSLSEIVAGVGTAASPLSYNLYFQYAYCCLFGFFIACISTLRSISIVKLYGLDALTNATGMILLFQGIGSLLSTPIAGVLKTNFGYNVAFYAAGFFIMCSGLALMPINALVRKENKKNTIQNKTLPATKNKQIPDRNSAKGSTSNTIDAYTSKDSKKTADTNAKVAAKAEDDTSSLKSSLKGSTVRDKDTIPKTTSNISYNAATSSKAVHVSSSEVSVKRSTTRKKDESPKNTSKR